MSTLALVETAQEQLPDEQQQPVNKFKYPEFAGPAGEDYLNAICQQILPTALWRTWRAAVAFQPSGKPCFVSPDKIAEATKPGVRKIYLDLQKLEGRHLLQTTAFMYQKTQNDGTISSRAVTAKNFEGLYDLAHEYHLWIESPLGRALPPERVSVKFIIAAPDLMKKLIRFDNYRRLLLCKKPGRKPKLQEEDSWYDGTFDSQAEYVLPPIPVCRTDDPKVNLYLNTLSNEDSPKRISNDSASNDLSNKDSPDSEVPSNKGGGALSAANACSQKRACSAGDYTKSETNEKRLSPLPNDTPRPTQTNPTNPNSAVSIKSGAKQSARRESAETEPAVQLARRAMALAQGGQPGRAKRKYPDDGKPRPRANTLVSSFVKEIGPVLGDRNLKGSVTRALRIAEACNLADLGMETLACLVRAYWVAKGARTINEEHIDRETRQEYRMPYFLTMFKTFAEAWVKKGNWEYTNDDLEADLSRDDRLQLWWVEFYDRLAEVQHSPQPERPNLPTPGREDEKQCEGEAAVPLGEEAVALSTNGDQAVADEVVIDTANLRDFWLYGGSQGLEDAGYHSVDLDGDLLTCQAYEQRRCRLLEHMLATEPLALSPEAEYEVQTYLAWVSQFVCPPEREAELLAHLPPGIPSYLHQLEEILDLEQYAVTVLVAPISHRRVIEVSVRNDPAQAWLLPYPKHVNDFISWWKHAMQLSRTGTGQSDAS